VNFEAEISGWAVGINAHETLDSLRQFMSAGCLDLCLSISSQFTHKMCAVAKNRKKISEIPYFVIDVDAARKPITSA